MRHGCMEQLSPREIWIFYIHSTLVDINQSTFMNFPSSLTFSQLMIALQLLNKFPVE